MSDSNSNMKGVYILGGVCALLTVLAIFIEIGLTFLPGGNVTIKTPTEWFTQLNENTFMALRNLGLMNIVMVSLGIPVTFALFAAHRKVYKEFAALAMIISYIGAAIFYATNRAFSMLELSNQYFQVATDTQRTIIEAAGQAMLAVGGSHTPGTFLGFFLGGLASILMSVIMFRGKIFSKLNALAGIIGFSLLTIFDLCVSFMPSLWETVMVFAVVGGLLNLLWQILIGLRFFKLVRIEVT
jgi:hypothetical protein